MRTMKKVIRTADTASPTFNIVFMVWLFPLLILRLQAMTKAATSTMIKIPPILFPSIPVTCCDFYSAQNVAS